MAGCQMFHLHNRDIETRIPEGVPEYGTTLYIICILVVTRY